MAVCPLNDEPIVFLRGGNKIFCTVDGIEVSWKKCRQCQVQNSIDYVEDDTRDLELEI